MPPARPPPSLLTPQGAGAGGAGGAEGPITDEDLGLKKPLPWNDAFHIQPQHARDFKPMPPTSYTEALARQGRLLHGPERRALLRLHKVGHGWRRVGRGLVTVVRLEPTGQSSVWQCPR